MVKKNNNLTQNFYGVIMAGGIGSRFWPISTPNYPKQFHDILGTGKSLLQHTFNRLQKLIPVENILVSSNQNYKALLKGQLPDITAKQWVLEPCMRNTAPAVLYASLKIVAQNEQALILIAPSDHWIEKEEVFTENLKTAFEACRMRDILMTLGIQPSYPNTGYGYVQFENGKEEIKRVRQFVEKPDLEKAKSYIKSGDYLWNAGIFVWSAKSIIRAFQQHLPKMLHLFNKGKKVWNTDFEDDFVREIYSRAANISIDYGILEKAENVYTLPVNIGWNDLGTWGALYQKLGKDSQQNAVINAKSYFVDASGNMLRTKSGKKVIIKGLNDFIIVESEETLLILPKEEEQMIKELSKSVE